MKSTGIIRRIDELGRIVIPKELRRSLRLQENDPLELGIAEDEGGRYLIASPYSPVDQLPTPAGKLLSNILPKLKGSPITLILADSFTRTAKGAGATIDATAIFKMVRDEKTTLSNRVIDDTFYLAIPVHRSDEIIAALILVGPQAVVEDNRTALELSASILNAVI